MHNALTFRMPDGVVEGTRGELIANETVGGGAVLMRIPTRCLVTLKSVERSIFGRNIFRAVSEVDPSKMHNSKDDVVLALYLAAIAVAGEGSPSEQADGTSSTEMFYKPYLATLPEDKSYNKMVRRWKDPELERLLGGTSLQHRARRDMEGLRSDYNLVAGAWEITCKHRFPREHDDARSAASKTNQVGQNNLPPIEKFDQMLAAVTSRGFAGMGGEDGLDAMVPIVDLMNHKRGVGQQKDVTYGRSAEDGSVCVKALRAIRKGSTIRNTYGAKGNAQLLSCYGFCLANNLEPDGSSNDVLEFVANPKMPRVNLRAGPRSYTFGGFVKALDMFSINDAESNEGSFHQKELDDGTDDIEAFLDQCDEEEEEDMCVGFGFEKTDENIADGQSEKENIEIDCAALDAFANALESAKNAYALRGNELSKALSVDDSSPEHYAAILVSSEMRTIDLYLRAIHIIKNELRESAEKATTSSSPSGCAQPCTEELVEDQAQELASAFLKIRHPTYARKNMS